MRRATSGPWRLPAAIAAAALLAPLLAGDRPLLVAGPAGIEAPGLGSLLALLPESEAPYRMPAGAWAIHPLLARGPLEVDLRRRLEPPGRGAWLGTDELGRDVLARLVHGARPSLAVALLATVVSLALGVPLGAAAGYGGRLADGLLSRLVEASLAFPALVLLMFISALSIGAGGGAGAGRSLAVVGLAVGFVRWASIARYTRGEVRRLAAGSLADAAKAMGAGPLRILGLHLVPAGIGPVAVAAAFGAASAVTAEAALSFLGLGVQPPAPTWGQMIASASARPDCWWMLVFPGLAVATTVAAFHLAGERLRGAR
ncbi:MAG TPA: ABC transporter permease [Candidatus Polarisedimenticolia bacterium]|nr:ABC transporter permease [Candidatus Polarisedimenticolia bacterium]